MKLKKKKTILIITIVISALLFLYLYRYEFDIENYSYEQIKELNQSEQLSLHEILKLASSYQVLTEIFEKKDTTVIFFKEQIKSGYIQPYFVLTEEAELNINKNEIAEIEKLIRANNKSFQIISILAAYCENMESNISTEVQFLLRRLNGEKIFCSSEILRHEKINYILFRLGIQT